MGCRLNLTGQRFGRLIAIRDVGKDKKGQRLWECRCDCGKVVVVRVHNLRCGNTKSCGCFHSERARKCCRLRKGEGGFNGLFHDYQCNAKSRNRKFSLTKGAFRKLTKQNCFYCGKNPEKVITNDGRTVEGKKWAEYIYNGVDRVDNTKNYTVDNCVACCSQCNWAKKDLTQQEFYDWIKRVYKHSFGS